MMLRFNVEMVRAIVAIDGVASFVDERAIVGLCEPEQYLCALW